MFPLRSWTSTQRLKSSSLPLSQLLNDEKMQELNARVDVDGEDYTTASLDFLQEENLIAD